MLRRKETVEAFYYLRNSLEINAYRRVPFWMHKVSASRSPRNIKLTDILLFCFIYASRLLYVRRFYM